MSSGITTAPSTSPVSHLRDRLLARLHAHRVDRVGTAGPACWVDVDPLAAQLDLLGRLRHQVHERHLRLVGPARQREADQRGDHDRVEHEQGHQQRRAAQDLQVLQQQPAHQWPRWRRKATKASSKSPRSTGPRSRSTDLLQLARRPAEQQLAVGQHEHALGVALGLLDVVGGVDDGRAAPRPGEHELPHALALARVERGAGLVEQQHGLAARAGRPRCSPAGGCRRRARPPGRRRGRAGRSGRASAPRSPPGRRTFSSRANSSRFSRTVSLP